MKDIQCIGFVMDGNRRWAKELGKPTLEGHTAGYKKFKEVVKWCKNMGIKNVVLYAFSTENWKRTEEEVGYLMKLLENAITNDMHFLHDEKVRLRIIGQKERLPESLQKAIATIEEETKDYTEGTAWIAISYGGRADIVQAANKLIKEGKEVDEESFSQALWTADMPEPDIIVRTGEAMRLSNFLTWDSAYSELYFTATMWPDFDKEEFDYILESYDKEQRRKGK